MAIIKCPSCRERVSDKREVCPNCGYGISDHETGLSLSEAQSRVQRRRGARLQMHAYLATLMFVAGVAWMLWETDGNVVHASTPSMFLAGLGVVWYVAVRVLMVLHSRRKGE